MLDNAQRTSGAGTLLTHIATRSQDPERGPEPALGLNHPPHQRSERRRRSRLERGIFHPSMAKGAPTPDHEGFCGANKNQWTCGLLFDARNRTSRVASVRPMFVRRSSSGGDSIHLVQHAKLIARGRHRPAHLSRGSQKAAAWGGAHRRRRARGTSSTVGGEALADLENKAPCS